MGQRQSAPGGGSGDKKDDKEKKKKYEPPVPTRVGKKKRKAKGPDSANKLPSVTPHTRCRLRQLKLERIKVRVREVENVGGLGGTARGKANVMIILSRSYELLDSNGILINTPFL